MLLEAQDLISSGTAAREVPTTCSLPDRVERVRWFLLPSEACEYCHGRTDPVLTNTGFAPRSYKIQTKRNRISTRQQRHVENKAQGKPAANSRNKHFTLNIHEDSSGFTLHIQEAEDSSDEESDSSASRAVYTDWVSMDGLDRDDTPPSCEDPVTSDKPYASCEDLGTVGGPVTYSRKERKRKTVKTIKKKLKSFLWPSQP